MEYGEAYLYKLASMIKRSGKTTDEVSTPFGIRTLSWPVKRFTPEGPVAGIMTDAFSSMVFPPSSMEYVSMSISLGRAMHSVKNRCWLV